MNIDQLKAAAMDYVSSKSYDTSVQHVVNCARFRVAASPEVILALIQKLEEATKWVLASERLPPVDEIVLVYGMAGWAVHNGTIWLGMDRSGNKREMKWTPEYWMMAQKLPPLPASSEDDAKAIRNEEK